jgi:hypothetical protein
MVVWRLSRHAGAVSRAVVEAHAGWEGGSRFQFAESMRDGRYENSSRVSFAIGPLCIFLDGPVGRIELREHDAQVS